MVETKIIIKTTDTFDKWFKKIKNSDLKSRIIARLINIQGGYFGDYKSVGDNVFELRFMVHGGIRVYYTFKNNTLVLLLCAGNKSSQKRDIEKAKELAKMEE